MICDQRVMLDSYCTDTAKKYPEHQQRTRFTDPDPGTTPVFLGMKTVKEAR